MIIFEGIDRIGKSTLAKNFANDTKATYLYEPFGETPEELTIRNTALTKDIDPLSREYLLLGNRCMGYSRINKELPESNLIVSDRSFISGMVYAYMEGFPFEYWFQLYEPIYKRWSYRVENALVILCTNKEIKLLPNSIDRYDSKPEKFHREVEGVFRKALSFLKYQIVGLEYFAFDISFKQTEEENLNRLREKIIEFQRDPNLITRVCKKCGKEQSIIPKFSRVQVKCRCGEISNWEQNRK